MTGPDWRVASDNAAEMRARIAALSDVSWPNQPLSKIEAENFRFREGLQQIAWLVETFGASGDVARKSREIANLVLGFQERSSD